MTGIVIGDGVTEIMDESFLDCPMLTTVTIGKSVTRIDQGAFAACPAVRSVYFLGNAPNDLSQFDGTSATVFFLAGTTGWTETFGGRPTMLWNATDDLDQDGMNNQEEMLAGTDPLNASSWLAFESAPQPGVLVEADRTAVPAGRHALYFQSVTGMRYEIHSSDIFGRRMDQRRGG